MKQSLLILLLILFVSLFPSRVLAGGDSAVFLNQVGDKVVDESTLSKAEDSLLNDARKMRIAGTAIERLEHRALDLIFVSRDCERDVARYLLASRKNFPLDLSLPKFVAQRLTTRPIGF